MAGVMVARNAGADAPASGRADPTHGTRVAVTGAGPCVFAWQAAQEALGRHFAVASLADAALDAELLLSDLHASQAYRAQLVRVLARKAVQALL
jgi:carbon-monoxide dehydrogenase medium subunit